MADGTTLSTDLGQLLRWCTLANHASFAMWKVRDTCILTSHALAAFLRARGLDAEVFRAEAHVHSPDRSICGAAVGWDGDGTRRKAAAPDMWHGHLAVTCEGFVLDPTIDQMKVGGKRIRPAVFPVPERWDEDGGYSHRWEESGLTVSYRKYRRQAGWKSAGDARPSHWQPVTDLMEEFIASVSAA